MSDMTIDIDAQTIIDWVRTNYEPDDVFNDSELEDWARNNGFIEEE